MAASAGRIWTIQHCLALRELGRNGWQVCYLVAVVQRLDLTHRHIEVAFTFVGVALDVVMIAMVWLLAPLVGLFFDLQMGATGTPGVGISGRWMLDVCLSACCRDISDSRL